MSNKETYNSYGAAFDEIKRLALLQESFKLTHVRTDGSIKIVSQCLLRKQTPSMKDKNGAYKFNYIDKQNDEYGTAFIPLLLSVNDKPIIIPTR